MENLNQHIVAKFSNDFVYEFRVEKSESLWFMGSTGKSFRTNYIFQVRSIGDGLFEAFYPDTIFYQVKDIDEIQDILRTTKSLKSKTIFYELDKQGRRVNLNNFEELNIEKYILQDLINLHYCEELETDEDYYIDLTEKDSFLGAIAKKTLKLLNLNFDECSIFRFQSSEPDAYVVSLFKSKNALSAIDDEEFLAGKHEGIDFKKLKNDFVSNELNFDELIDGTYSLHEYHISKDNHMLSRYENKFKINSNKMRKHINYTMKRFKLFI